MNQTKTVLVTGCTGLVGQGLCYYFLNRGYHVIGTARRKILSNHPRFKTAYLDLTQKESIEQLSEIVPSVDVFIHNAAITSRTKEAGIEENINILNVNFIGTYRILKILEKYSGKKMIYISGTRLAQRSLTSAEEEIPYFNKDEYSTSKLAGELVCHQFNLLDKVKSIIIRISAPYGYVLNDAVVSRFVKQVMNNQDITLWGTGAREQVFTFVEDIAFACELAFKADTQGVFNITGGPSTSMKVLAEATMKAFPGSRSRIVFENKEDPQEGTRVYYSIDKAKKEIGYAPHFNIEKGLAKVFQSISDKSQFEVFREVPQG